MNNTELTKTLWAIESHVNARLASPHENAGDTRLQEALEDAQDLQTRWNVHRALHMDFCLRKAAEQGAIASELYKELIERLWTAMRAEPDPEPVVPPKRDRSHKTRKVARLWQGLAQVINNNRHHYEYGDLHHAAEILAGYPLEPVNDQYERLIDWLHGNRMSANAHAASEREYQMWVFLEKRGWSHAVLKRLSDEATQGG